MVRRMGGGSTPSALTFVRACPWFVRHEQEEDVTPFDPQLLMYPVTDYSLETPSYEQNAQGYLLTSDSMRWFWSCWLPDEATGRHRYASPLRVASVPGGAGR